MTETPELKPCPFCGGPPRYYRYNDAACADEQCPGFLMRHCPPDLWNRRKLAVTADDPQVLVSAALETYYKDRDLGNNIRTLNAAITTVLLKDPGAKT